MVLYNAPSSYYSMVARLALLEAGLPFESNRMDIHFAKQQLAPWYQAINPHMTVPALVDGSQTLIDSREILRYAATHAGPTWCDGEPKHQARIEQIVQAFYSLAIEELTFGQIMLKHPPLRFVFMRVLSRIVKALKLQLSTCADPDAVRRKIAINERRIEYFTDTRLRDKLNVVRQRVADFLQSAAELEPTALLFGDRVSSADVVCGVLLGRLQMIGEDQLLESQPLLKAWFARFQERPAFKKADIWTRFQPTRILRRR